MDAYIADLLEAMHGQSLTNEELAKLKFTLAKKHPGVTPPANYELRLALDGNNKEQLALQVQSKPMRTASGVAVIAVMSKPGKCPHGTCTMCPGGIGSTFGDVPQSYTGNEPATMRGMRNHYDSYLQVINRLEQYHCLGHAAQKAEVIVMGGTFLAFAQPYKEQFIGDIYRALNDFSTMFYRQVNNTFEFNMSAFKEFFELPGPVGDSTRTDNIHKKLLALKTKHTDTLVDAQAFNELAAVRCVGLTIETKPDYGLALHGKEMLRYGATRVELGLQSVYDDVLTAINRGHTTAENIASIQQLKDLGFKINAHIMPGLPGVDRERDLKGLRAFFEDPAYRPDMVKIYPCMVMPGTALEKDYLAGTYQPLTTDEAADRIVEFKRHIPPYCRVMRIQRDIPTKFSMGGLDKNNLRQIVDDLAKRRGVECQCIRCREIGLYEHGDVHFETILYKSSGRVDIFIQAMASPIIMASIQRPLSVARATRLEGTSASATPAQLTPSKSAAPALRDRLVGFFRLRYPMDCLAPEITSTTAIVRELHVYGASEALGVQGRTQHRGIGKALLAKAEEYARQDKKSKLIIISGVGVREYYRKLGYVREGPYMGKSI